MKLYCGVDLHSTNAVYAIKEEGGKSVFRRRLPNDLVAVLRVLEPFRDGLKEIAVESTYNWPWLVDGLMEHGYAVKLANPAAIDQYDGLKDADDLTDASFLAELLRLDILPSGYIYPKATRPVRDLLRRRLLIVQQRTAQILSVQNMVERESSRRVAFRKLLQLEPGELSELLHDDELLLFTAGQQADLIRYQSDRIRMIEEKVLEHAKLKPEFELLLTIPGVGRILTLTIMLETGEISRFAKVGNYTSYCRCARAKHWSNGKKKRDNNRKNGNRYLSWAYVEAAHHALRCCKPARSFYDRKKSHACGALATKALASKLSKAAYYVMKRQEPFDIGRVFG